MTPHKQPEGVEGELERGKEQFEKKFVIKMKDERYIAGLVQGDDISDWWLDKCREFYEKGVEFVVKEEIKDQWNAALYEVIKVMPESSKGNSLWAKGFNSYRSELLTKIEGLRK